MKNSASFSHGKCGRNANMRWVIAAALVLAMSLDLKAHDVYHDWQTRNGVSCCDDKDCGPAVAWQNADGNWTARQDGREWEIPAHAVLDRKSPDGRSHLCIWSGQVMCFVPGEVRS